MLRCWTFCCASTHTSCYAAGRSLALRHIHHASLLAIHSVAYPHIRHAKLLTSLALPHIALGGQITVGYFCCGKTLDFPILRWLVHGIWNLEPHIFWRKINMCKLLPVSDNSTIILWLSDVVTDTASYRRWNHVVEKVFIPSVLLV